MSKLQEHHSHIQADLPITYYLKKHPKAQNRLLIFLHGYTDSAMSFLRRSFEGVELDYDLLAPNGPFPVPVRTDSGFKEAYSWYFEDHSIGRIIIPKEVTIQILNRLLIQLKLQDSAKTIIGFSQGGFLAPKLAEKLSRVEKIIGIGCNYRPESYNHLKGIKLFGIHGTLDSVVNHDQSYANFQSLTAQGIAGEFASILNMDHKMNDQAKQKLIEFIQK